MITYVHIPIVGALTAGMKRSRATCHYSSGSVARFDKGRLREELRKEEERVIQPVS